MSEMTSVCLSRTITDTDGYDPTRFCAEKGARDFSRQYFGVYAVRLASCSKQLQEAAAARWGRDLAQVPLHQLEEQVECVVVGTLMKRQALKPSILQEISEEFSLQPPAKQERFISDDDDLVLEDELARVRLAGAVDVQGHVTGIVCALRGSLLDTGRFHVTDVCYRQLAAPSKISRPLPCTTPGPLVLMVSGLGVGSSGGGGGGGLASAQLLCDLVTGHLGNEQLQQKMARVTRVVIAGDSLGSGTKDRDCMKRPAYLSSDTTQRSVEAVRVLDQLLEQLVASCDVDLMPGESDPTTYMWPQRPFHRCLLPRASKYSTLRRVGNPHTTAVGDCQLLGTSGQNVDDLYRYSVAEDPLVALRRLLQWTHLCPSAPDTLACFPFEERDPFLMDTCPHVLFAGNQRVFSTGLATVDLSGGGGVQQQQVRLINIPRFSRTSSVVLLDTNTLQVEELVIGSEL